MRKVFLFCVCCFLLMFSSAMASNSGEVDVIATGIGNSEDAAKIQAYRNAIRTVIGTMVVSDVVIKNDELINNTVLSHTDGYVVKSSQVGNSRIIDGNLFEVTMNVTVKSKQLQKKLQAEKINTATLDGAKLFEKEQQAQEDAFAQKATQDKANQDASAILVEKIKNVPAGLLHAIAVTDKLTPKSVGGFVQLTIPVHVSVDQKAYSAFAKDIIATMQKMGFETKYAQSKLTVHAERTQFTLMLCDLVNKAAKTTRWKFFTIPENIFLPLVNQFNTFNIQVDLLDKAGNIVSSNSLTHTEGLRKAGGRYALSGFFSSIIGGAYDKKFGHLAIIPEVKFHINYGGNNTHIDIKKQDNLVFPVVFDLTEEEFKNISEVKCSLSNVPFMEKTQ